MTKSVKLYKEKNKDSLKKKRREDALNLTDRYIRESLAKHSSLNSASISSELIILKRTQMRSSRKLDQHREIQQ